MGCVLDKINIYIRTNQKCGYNDIVISYIKKGSPNREPFIF